MDVDQLIGEILADLKANRLRLPSQPQVGLRINDLIDSDGVTSKQVARLVGTDPGLAGRLIQVANSPLVRTHTPVEDVQGAVLRLGLRTVRSLVNVFLVRHMFHTRHPALRQRINVLWTHSVHVAAISYVLALRFTDLKPEEAMLAGLVHDIGKLPLVTKAEDEPALVNDERAFQELSRRLHPVLGRVILQSWRFAPEFVDVAGEHDRLERESEKTDLTDVVMVANLHSYTGRNQADNPHRDANWQAVPAFVRLGLDPLGSIDTLKEASEQIREIRSLLAGY